MPPSVASSIAIRCEAFACDNQREFVSTDFSPFRDTLAGTAFAAASIVETPRALAGGIARIAEMKFRRGLAVDPAEVDANYVRRSDAELFWKES
jgi:hypothetical protein